MTKAKRPYEGVPAYDAGYKDGYEDGWDDCKKMVDGYPGAVYKGFATLAEAEAFLNGNVAGGTLSGTTRVSASDTKNVVLWHR